MTQNRTMNPTALPHRKLPIGIQTLRIIREEGYYYVDKTALAIALVEGGRMYFLSRPRRSCHRNARGAQGLVQRAQGQ